MRHVKIVMRRNGRRDILQTVVCWVMAPRILVGGYHYI